MTRYLLVLTLSINSVLSHAQEIDFYINPNDCISSVKQMNQIFEYSFKSKMTIVSDKANAYLIKEMLKKYIPDLQKYTYDFVVNDSLYETNMTKTAYQSFISLSFQGKFLANFGLKSFYAKGYNEKLDEILVSLKHPFLNYNLNFPIYYPKITSNGFYSINKALEKLEYYFESEQALVMKEISYDEIEELSLSTLYSGQSLADVKEYTRLKNVNLPSWGRLTLGPGGHVYGDTLMISYIFLHVADTHNYQMNVVYGMIWVFEDQIVDHKVYVNENMYTLENWPGGLLSVKYNNEIFVKKYYEGTNKTYENRYTSIAKLSESGELEPLPIVFDTTLYFSHTCGPNSSSAYLLSDYYMANTISFLEVVNLEEKNIFKIPWDYGIIEKYYSRIRDTCAAYSVIGFKSMLNSFHFLIYDSTVEDLHYTLLSYVGGETKYRYLSMFNENDFLSAGIFGESIIMGLDKANLKWVPVTLF